MATATATEMATLLVATATATLGGGGEGGEGGGGGGDNGDDGDDRGDVDRWCNGCCVLPWRG